MIDIHCHILPYVDDGPTDMDEAVAMAKIASRDGISAIVATPHIDDISISSVSIGQQVERLNNRLSELGIDVKILRGADVKANIDPHFLRGYTINNTEYILLEFPPSYLPGNTKAIIFRMVTSGYRPIITHPERNHSVVKKPDLLFDMLDSGVSAQITAESLVGAFGPDARECARHLLKCGAVSFIATDAHSSTLRPPVLSKGLRVAERIIGEAEARKLVTTNPEAVVAGAPLNGQRPL
jgi:protein-tyrosine phosphatase